MPGIRGSRDATAAEIAGSLMRGHSTAAVLFHHALAERLGLGPTDLKCLDLLRDHGPMTGSDLAALTGLTTGAITGVVSRLEDAGFVRRTPDAQDGRRQILSPTHERAHDVHALFKRMHDELAAVLADFTARELSVIGRFLTTSTELIYGQIARLRAEKTIARPARAARAQRVRR
jgi:DNA-binding MarR family transcriptional regulator